MREFRPDKVPKPKLADLPAHFQKSGFDLEIGAGQGLHAVQYCERNPERRLIALERTETKYSAFRSRVIHHPHLSNLLPLRADAIHFVSHFVQPDSVNRIFLLYPNPYPKTKHANLRWHRSSFIHFLRSRMTSSGSLQIATNLRWYAEEAEAWLNRDGLFRIAQKREISSPADARTHFEKKYLERGETCFDLLFEKWVQ